MKKTTGNKFDSKTLKRRPNYTGLNSNDYLRNRPKSNLSADESVPYYQKLKNYLAINNTIKFACDHKDETALFRSNWPGWMEVRWMPKLQKDWYRLSYRLFCVLYEIKLESQS